MRKSRTPTRRRPDARLAAVGERGFLRTLVPRLARSSAGRFLVPPGDDAAVMRAGRLALTVDAITDGTHFRMSWARRFAERFGFPFGRALGWKLMGATLSDLASMGRTRDRWALVCLGGPASLKLSFLNDLHEGVSDVARAWQCALPGGDTIRSERLTISASAGGAMAGRALTRSGARAGDLVCVAGVIGDADAGLAVLDGRAPRMSRGDERYFVERFFRPQTHIIDGERLAASSGVSAMMDVSDSLLECVDILAEASHAGADIDADHVPVSREWRRRMAASRGPLHPLSCGEDYALLFTVRPAAVASLRRRVDFTVIGAIRRERGVSVRLGGRPVRAPGSFNHF